MGTVAKRRAALTRHHRVEVEHEGWADGAIRPLDIRSGDNVEVISGKDKGKRGIVERVQVERQRIVIRGVNLMKRHTKANTQGNVQGGIVDFNGPIAYSNVQLVCNRCEKKTRIAHQVTEEGVRVMLCRKCGERYERVTG
ncbi:MAG: 50S ribosomal protein L24 [Candidatus Dormibacteria bacterium]|jgi:large subunit ribosomal protein L24